MIKNLTSRARVTGVVLAGGGSRRIPGDKLQLPLGDKPLAYVATQRLVAFFGETVVVTDKPGLFNGLDVRVTNDLIKCEQKNTAVGIYSGLAQASNDMVFVVAADMPFVKGELIEYICSQGHEVDVVVPRVYGYLQPTCALYKRKCLDAFEGNILKGNYWIKEILQELTVKEISEKQIEPWDRGLLSFFNINTIGDYQWAVQLWKEAKG